MRHARMSGVDSADLAHTPLRQKIAALLPLPAFLKQKLSGDSPPDMSSLALWSSQAGTVDPGVLSTWGKAAATAATIAIAGVGAGAATNPAGDARAAIDGRGLLERLTGGSTPGGGSDGEVLATPAAPSGAATGGGAAATRGAATNTPRGGSPSSSKRDAGTSSGGSSGEKSSGSGSSGSTSGTAPSGAPASALPTASAPAAPDATEDSNPISDTLDRLTGGGSDSDSGGSDKDDSGSGSGGSGSTGSTSGGSLPNLLPGASAPSGQVPAGGSAPTDPVGEVVGGAGKSVEGTVDSVTEATQDILGE
jgi:hypothetical protein